VTVIGVGGERATSYAPSLELLARNRDRLPIDLIVTHRLRLEDAREALELAQRDGAMKVVLDPALS
jgi:threonine dehydrogenase-like Zn-dependent dehydrogenase